MTLKTCLRCDWEGETKEPQCPNCGTQPLYVVPFASEEVGAPARSDPEERSRETPTTARRAPSDRSGRSVGAFALAALVLSVALGTWLNSHEGRSAPAASSSPVHEPPAGDGSPTPVVSPSLTPGSVDPNERPHPLIGRHAVTVDGVRFSFNVPQYGWGRFDSISINKSTVGPQGAEAIIFWTSFPDGDNADPCAHLLGPPVGASAAALAAADLAAAVATAPGTELVTGPSDVTVGGRAAKHVVLNVRKDVGCDPGYFYTWHDMEWGPLWPTTGVGDTIRVWIVDVDGTRLFIEAETTEQADSDLEEEIHQIVESIRFD